MLQIEDSYKHKGLRRQMITELEQKQLGNPDVLEAMADIPRHAFLDKAFLSFAYQDQAFPIGCEQTISHPSTVAVQSSLLEVFKGCKVLEIGTGSGYQTAVLCALGAKVFSIERQRTLFQNSKNILSKLRYRYKGFFGDGYEGLPAFAPFDRVLVTCGAPFIPEKLVEQLAPGGKMVIPVGDEKQTMHVIEKDHSGNISQKKLGEFRFVPMLSKKTS